MIQFILYIYPEKFERKRCKPFEKHFTSFSCSQNQTRMEQNIDIFDSVKSQAVNEITPEVLELGLDAMLSNETLKDIPIVGLAFKSFSLYQHISEAFFVKKLLNFLFAINEIPIETRLKFISKLESETETKRAGQKLLVTLNRLDDIDKASIVGNLFKHTILGEISYDHFSQLSHMIDNSYIHDLKKLSSRRQYIGIDNSTQLRLYKSGFFDQNISDVKKQLRLERFARSDKDYNGVVQPKFEYSENIFTQILSKYGFVNYTSD